MNYFRWIQENQCDDLELLSLRLEKMVAGEKRKEFAAGFAARSVLLGATFLFVTGGVWALGAWSEYDLKTDACHKKLAETERVEEHVRKIVEVCRDAAL